MSIDKPYIFHSTGIVKYSFNSLPILKSRVMHEAQYSLDSIGDV